MSSEGQITKPQKALVTSASLGYMMWGVVASIGPLAAAGAILSSSPEVSTKIFSLIIPTISLLAGNIIMGYMSDKIGRKKIFFITLILYGLGIFAVYISTNFAELAIGLALAEFGAGGEEPPSLAVVAEDFSPSRRGKFLTLIPNFNNIGTLLFYLILLFNVLSGRVDILVFGFLIIVIALFARVSIPESYRWERSRGRVTQSEETLKSLTIENDGQKSKKPSSLAAFSILSMLAVSQYLTFGLMTYVIGPYEFPGTYTDNVIVGVGMAGSSVAGFIALFLINRNRTNYTLFAFGGGFISLLAILAVALFSKGLFAVDPILYFYPLLFISMMFSEFAWASRTTLEPEMFSTSWRASSIGLVRVVPMIAYALSIVYASSLGLVQYIEFNGFIWFIGLLGAIWLKALKVDTSKVSLDYEEDSAKKLEISP
jgi:putative MFS transporter